MHGRVSFRPSKRRDGDWTERSIDGRGLDWRHMGLGGQEIITRSHFVHFMKHLWPAYFTLSIFGTLSSPVTNCIRLSFDFSVQYWVGSIGFVAALIPLHLVAMHMVHVHIGKPRLIPVFLTMMLPPFGLMLLAQHHMIYTSSIARILTSRDCTNYPPKREVERAWGVAARLYNDCLVRSTRENNVPLEDGLKFIRLTDCSEYMEPEEGEDPWQEFRKDWSYLEHLEKEHHCAGWCNFTQPLWSYSTVRDSCSSAAGSVLINRTNPLSQRILVYSLILLVVYVLAVAFISNLTHVHGLAW